MPDLRLTPERREQINRRLARLQHLYDERLPIPYDSARRLMRDVTDLLHDLDVLERLLRRAVAAQIGWDPLDGPGHECLTCGESPTAHAEGCWVGDAQTLLQGIDAALAALRGERHA